MKISKHTILPIVFLLGILFNGCLEKKPKIIDGNLKTIIIMNSVSNSSINLSGFIKDVRIISLEFNKKCILGKIKKIVISPKDIYIQDRKSVV